MKKVIFTIICLVGFVFASGPIKVAEPIKTCGTEKINKFDVKNYLSQLKSRKPQAYQSLSQQAAMVIQQSNRLNSRKFWAYNFKDENNPFYLIDATLHRSGDLIKIWVEDATWDKGYVTENILDELLNQLENSSGQNSLYPDKGIVEIDTTLFGQQPNDTTLDNHLQNDKGEGIINFLIMDIKDEFDSTATNSQFIAGYFSSHDQTKNATSNQMNLLYLDATPGIYYRDEYRTNRVLSTTAHELQHLIHYNYDKDEETWINEGLSELAGTYCGYGLDFPAYYLGNTNQNLIKWNGDVKDYARVNLWTLYCAEQLGLEFIKELVQTKENGIHSFDLILQKNGFTDSFNSIFRSWIVANWLNNISIDSKYGYQWNEAKNLKANPTKLIHKYPQKNVAGQIVNYAAEYHNFRGQDSLVVEFINSNPNKLWVVHKENGYRVETPLSNFITESNFTEDSSYVLILFSLENDINYLYDADANYSLQYFDLGYNESDQPDVNLSFNGIAANRFEVPASGVTLESVKFWNGSTNYQATIHLYDRNSNGFPGNNLTAPIDTFLSSESGWITVNIPEINRTLVEGDEIFAGVEINTSGKSIGYDSTPQQGYSYYKNDSQWSYLSDFEIGEEPANGTWLIRTVFSGLIPSHLLDKPSTAENLIVEGNYPNPYQPGDDGILIRFQIPEPGEIKLNVYNTLGQRVANLKQFFGASSEIQWKGRGYNGTLTSGIYFYQLIFTGARTGKVLRSDFQKMIVVK